MSEESCSIEPEPTFESGTSSGSKTGMILGIVAVVAGVLTLLVSCANSVIGALVFQGGEIESIFEEIQRELQP